MDADIIEEFNGILGELLQSTGGAISWTALSEIGWPDLLEEDGVAAVQTLFPNLAKNLTTTTALDAVALHGVGLGSGPDTIGVLFPLVVTNTYKEDLSVGASVRVAGIVARGGDEPLPASFMTVLATRDGQTIVAVSDLAEIITAAPSAGLDPETGWRLIVDTEVEVTEIVASGAEGQQRWNRSSELVRFAVATELAAISHIVLEMTSDHVRSRNQFGRPLGMFQAVKHRLAQAAVEAAAADTTLAVAAKAIRDDRPGLSVLLARIQCGVAATESLAHAQQLFGAMGYSWELPLHRYVRRAFMLDTIDGPLQSLELVLGKLALAENELPRLEVF
jgi:hypothetical protein